MRNDRITDASAGDVHQGNGIPNSHYPSDHLFVVTNIHSVLQTKYMLIQLFGIPGSGKSYLCRQLERRGVKCFGTDELLINAFHKVKGQHRNRDFHSINKNVPRVDKAATQQARLDFLQQDQNVVLEGLTLGDFKGATRIFIKLSRKELQDSYRRLWARELNKLCDNKNGILQLLRTQRDLHRVTTDIQFLTNQAVDLPLTFAEYEKMYDGALAFERKKGSQIVAKNKVVQRILRLRASSQRGD